MSDADTIFAYAIVFIVTFFIGGFVGTESLPEFAGRFFISGFLFALGATGAITLIVKLFLHH